MPENFGYDGVGWNKDWIESKSFKEFSAEFDVNSHWFEGDPKRKEKIQELYSLAGKQDKSEVGAE